MLTQNQLEVLGAAYEALERVFLFGVERGIKILAHITPQEDTAWVGLANGPTLTHPFLMDITKSSIEKISGWESELKADIDRFFKEERKNRIAKLQAEIDRLKNLSL